MAYWGFRSPSVHKSILGVAETPHTGSQDDYGQLGRYPLDKPQGCIVPFTGYHPISLLFIYEFVDWWDGMSCIVITCLVQWICADVLAWAGYREMWWWPASESNWKKLKKIPLVCSKYLSSWTGLGRSGHVRFPTFGSILHVSGPKLTCWGSFMLILHGFAWRSSKTRFWDQQI